MAIISLEQVTLGFGGPPLLDAIDLRIERGEYVGLLGRNGMGKTSLLKLFSGDLYPDRGEVVREKNLRVAYLPQAMPEGLSGAVGAIVAGGLDLDGVYVEEQTPGVHLEEEWQRQLQVEKVIARLQLDPQAEFSTLSAGLKRRVLLARGLVKDPDLLLLDEPTNHLDLAAIAWLEDFLARWGGTLVFVTHDRAFLQRLSTRIVELDRGHLVDWKSDYATFIQRKEARLSAEQEQDAEFDKKLAQEEAWIRKGVEARRTRNEGRVRALHALRALRAERRSQPARVRAQIQEARRSGRLVLEAERLSFAYDGRQVVGDFSTVIQRGDRVGIIGPNGSGKTTLLRLLLGELQPQSGSLRLGANLEIAYFDQLRQQLDEDKSVLDNVGLNSDWVTINGRKRQLIGYLGDFLFSPDRVYDPIFTLSGGERNRLLLARLFTQPANLLIMDEPTNDLDIETLELLEDLLLEFKGTLLLVSHDRVFLNNLVTSTLALEGDGRVSEVVGGYDDWLRYNQDRQSAQAEQVSAKAAGLANRATDKGGSVMAPGLAGQDEAPRRLTYREQRARQEEARELAALPARIEALEAEQHALTQAMTDPAFYQQDGEAIAAASARLKTLEEELTLAFERWEELEARLEG